MFDIGFLEMFMIMVIALVVVGPERLPGMARKAGALLGKMRRFVSNVKDDINKEIKADELKKIVQEQAESSGIHEIIEETRETFDKAETEYHSDSVQSEDAKLVNDALAQQSGDVDSTAIPKESKTVNSSNSTKPSDSNS